MTFLPIVERELRVAATRKSTYRVRLLSALFASLACGLILLFSLAAVSGLGSVLLWILTAYAAFFCVFSGVLTTADCLSSEKREGTLGLLFLTDLKGYDVVLGKFFARGLATFYGLLATFPVMAIVLLLGGVTAGEFWRVLLALLNLLFTSLSAGLFVSALSRDDRKAFSATFAWVIFLNVFIPLAVGVERTMGMSTLMVWVSWLSPLQALLVAKSAAASGGFWVHLLGSHAVGWLALALASWSLPRAWQDRPGGVSGAVTRPRPESRRARRADSERRQLLEINPMLGLMGSNRPLRYNIITVVFLSCAASTVALMAVSAASPGVLFRFAIPFGWLIKVWFAAQATRFFVEARRTGELELLLCTPLTDRDILQGQWLALKRLFYWPVATLLGYQLFVEVLQLMMGYRSGLDNFEFAKFLELGSALGWMVTFVADLFALGWLGMWLAISSKRPSQATALTVLFVIVLPSLIPCFPAAIIDVFILVYARSRLEREFRSRVLQQTAPIVLAPPRSAPRPDLNQPPLIRSA